MVCFNMIEDLIERNPNLEELTVIFITDGQETVRDYDIIDGVDPYEEVN